MKKMIEITRPRRPHRFALLGAALALVPAMACGASVDMQTTAGIAAPETTLKAIGNVDVLKNGLDALAANEVLTARVIRDSMPSTSLDRHILTWAIAMRGGKDVPSADIAAAAKALPKWPGLDTLRRNSERAISRENPAPNAVVAAFAGTAPETVEGTVALARAYVALGDSKAALAILSPFWRKEKLEAKDEALILQEFGSLIPVADHRVRMERMLYSDRVGSALRIAELAGAKQLADAWVASIRGGGDTAKLLKAVPASQRSAGYLFVETKYLRKQERFAEAANIMLKAPTDPASLIDPDAWWGERRVLSRELLDEGDVKTAYKIAAAHAAESPNSAVDAEFHAGWYALRGLNDAKTAARHFARIAAIAEGPISLSRAYYWLGRAAEAGGPGNATTYYKKAATYGATFYGQLAAERVGSRTLNVGYPSPTPADRQSFEQREAVTAIRRLEQAGYPALAGTLYRDLAGQLHRPGELAQLADMAEARGNHFLALRVGKIAAARGIDIGALSHPIGAIPASAKLSSSGKALAYAIARQESEFNIGAVSSAGARGLLQLMPATAKEVARKAGLTYSMDKLTVDAGYNATLGSAFLSEQLSRFDGSYILTFAGYNAGPGRARQWMARYGDPRGKDLDTVIDWIERIPYAETRSYVQRVMENYQVYKMRLTGTFDIEGDLLHGRR